MDTQTVVKVIQIIVIIYVIGDIILFLRNAKYMSSKSALGKMLYHCVWCAATYFGFGYLENHFVKFSNLLSHSNTISIILKVIPMYAFVLTIFYAVLAIVKIVKDGKHKKHTKAPNNQYSYKENFPVSKNNNVNNDDSIAQDHQDVY